MPRVAASNGIRPEIRALAVFKVGVPVTPAQINDHVGTGDYAAKYVSFLNTRYGFTITAQKDKRKVVSYTMIAEPDNAEQLRGMQPKAPKTKAPKTPKAPKVAKIAPAPAKSAKKTVTQTKVAAAKKSVADIKAKNLAKLKSVGAKFKAEKITDSDILNDAPKASSFSLDNDWDSVDGLDLSKLL